MLSFSRSDNKAWNESVIANSSGSGGKKVGGAVICRTRSIVL